MPLKKLIMTAGAIHPYIRDGQHGVLLLFNSLSTGLLPIRFGFFHPSLIQRVGTPGTTVWHPYTSITHIISA